MFEECEEGKNEPAITPHSQLQEISKTLNVKSLCNTNSFFINNSPLNMSMSSSPLLSDFMGMDPASSFPDFEVDQLTDINKLDEVINSEKKTKKKEGIAQKRYWIGKEEGFEENEVFDPSTFIPSDISSSCVDSVSAFINPKVFV
jgi:hypothetical protein